MSTDSTAGRMQRRTIVLALAGAGLLAFTCLACGVGGVMWWIGYRAGSESKAESESTAKGNSDAPAMSAAELYAQVDM
jgi:hypothetical protein